MPALSAAREAARRTQCVGNERQVGAAYIMYLKDNDQRWPYPYAAAGTSNHRRRANLLFVDSHVAWRTEQGGSLPNPQLV